VQVAWCSFYGHSTVLALQRVLAGKDAVLGCFPPLGAYSICEATQLLSIYSSMFMLMTQALISRVLVPGMSNFVNASVRRKRQRAVAAARPCFEGCGARVTLPLQVLHSGCIDDAGETSGMDACDNGDEGRSKQVAMMTAA
jgi:hypothetical protein